MCSLHQRIKLILLPKLPRVITKEGELKTRSRVKENDILLEQVISHDGMKRQAIKQKFSAADIIWEMRKSAESNEK